MLEYIKNTYNHWTTSPQEIVTPTMDKRCAITYSSDFIDIDENTNLCEYKDHLVCGKQNECKLIEEYMKLSEVRINKHIYFHDSYCNVKTYVHNTNANGGTVYVNLSYIE